MTNKKTIKIPDIGGASGVDVIEILVKPGDVITPDIPLITLESDKASMEIPAPEGGRVMDICVKIGDKVSEGDDILILEEETPSTPAVDAGDKMALPEAKPAEIPSETSPVEKSEPAQRPSVEQKSFEITVPDIGGATDVDVIEVMVQPGQSISKDQSLITLEGDKATMEIPSPVDGTVEDVSVKIGDKVSQGSLILTAKVSGEVSAKPQTVSTAATPPSATSAEKSAAAQKMVSSTVDTGSQSASQTLILAGPAVRRMARELGIDLSKVVGHGRKSRITKEDLQAYVKQRMTEKPAAGSGFAMPDMPVIDFSQFGQVEVKKLNKIKRLTGINLHRSWVTVPHVTQFDEADITDLEAFRKQESQQIKDYKLTLLAFVVKAVYRALVEFPQFNSSLDVSGESLVYKQYYHIGIAVDTPNGLVVPVIKHVDQLSIADIAKEMGRLSQKARDKGLTPADMSGGCFTISSLGGIGGTAFTPIVNAPEVAILGLSRSAMKPIYEEGTFKPRLMLPLSLSYDHRVIDGAEAARFTRFIGDLLSDMRRVLL